MPKKKLTEKLKTQIRKDYSRLRLQDFGGEALTYLKRVRGAAKGRRAKKETTARVDELIIPKDSELYEIISKAAKYKGMSISKFIKKHREAIEELMKEGDFVIQRETEYLIEDISKLKKGKKVFVNDNDGYVRTAPNEDILRIQQFTQHVIQHTDIFLIIYRVHYKLNGDLTHYLPGPDQYEELEESEEIEGLFDDFYPEITYLKSEKKKREKKDKRIRRPSSKSKKAKGSKTKPKHGQKRKKLSKNAKRK